MIDREAWRAAFYGGHKESDMTKQLNWTGIGRQVVFFLKLKLRGVNGLPPRLLARDRRDPAARDLTLRIASSPSLLFCCPVVSDSSQAHGLQHARLSCPSPSPRACSNSCALSRWCHPPISSSVVPFSSCLQSFPASGSFQTSQLFASGGQSIRASVSASVPSMSI